MSLFKFRFIAVLILCCLGFIIYSNTFSNSFHFDDDYYILSAWAIRDFSNPGSIWDLWPTRFIVFLSFALNYRFDGLSVFGYHLFNLSIHIVCAIFVWWLVRLIFATPVIGKSGIAGSANLFAFFAGLIFLAHPIQTQAVTYIFQRATSLAAFFYLLSLCLYIKSRLLQVKLRPSPASKWITPYVFSWLAACLAMFTKENTFTLPLMIILLEFSFFAQEKQRKLKSALPFLLLLPIIPLLIIFTKPVVYTDIQPLLDQPWRAGSQYFFTQLRVMVTYLRLLILPFNQNLDYDYPLYQSLLDLPVLISFIFLSSLIILAIKIFHRHRLLSFSIFWFFLALLPESSIIPIRDLIYEHRLYLPMAGFGIFLASITYYLLGEKNLKFIILILIFLIHWYAVSTYSRNMDWRDAFTLWNDTISKSPRKARPYNERGYFYYMHGDFTKAIADYNKAIELDPHYATAYFNRGFAYQEKQDFNRAIFEYSKAVEMNPNYVEAYNNRGVIYRNNGRLEDAIADFSMAIERDSRSVKAYLNRGIIYREKGDLGSAVSDFNKVLKINPSLSLAYYHRGFAYFLRKEYIKSWQDLEKAEASGLKADPEFINNLRRVLGKEN